MFDRLVESASHKRDIKRKGSFFVYTLVFYTFVLTFVGVGSIYAYDARLDEREEFEILSMMRFPALAESSARKEPSRQLQSSTGGGSPAARQAARREITIITPYVKVLEEARRDTRAVPPGVNLKIGNDDGLNHASYVGPIGPNFAGNGSSDGDEGGVVVAAEGKEPPPIDRTHARETPKESKPERSVALPSHLISSKAVQKPAPAYPEIAKRVGAKGTVAVQILIDEQGRVVSAQATSGHALLQRAAVEAARLARFTPTILGGRAVRVSGVIYYNFMLE